MDFPNSPAVNDTYSVGDYVWKWDGTVWKRAPGPSAIDAKGDILVGTADNTVDRTTVGANNTVFVADSAQTTGVKWSASLSGLTLTSPIISTISNTGTLTLPTSTDTLVGRATTDTLTNKTLTSPTVTSGTVTGSIVDQLEENWNIVASAASGTINLDVKTASVWYYTSNATGNHTLNIRGNSSTTLASFLAVGDSITVVWLNTNGTTAYYPNLIKIDNTVANYEVTVTPKWQGGVAPTSGNTSSVDMYVFTIARLTEGVIGVSTPTYAVFASQTQFK